MYRRMTMAVSLLVALSACKKDKEKEAAREKIKSERERDSVLGQSRIPGATGVAKAMTVADSAGNRVHVQDSVATSE